MSHVYKCYKESPLKSYKESYTAIHKKSLKSGKSKTYELGQRGMVVWVERERNGRARRVDQFLLDTEPKTLRRKPLISG